eukprot:TRINITY_DN96969_c0_g1_i1.p1 TRINITY_DN96969_c0_g1~~TRINITY_DN96969_c0_g1_i1.p1  ORF type:complete len:151 (+),score=24.78 TRINITY_DN96969_c0_g1_i1:99-551(+)
MLSRQIWRVLQPDKALQLRRLPYAGQALVLGSSRPFFFGNGKDKEDTSHSRQVLKDAKDCYDFAGAVRDVAEGMRDRDQFKTAKGCMDAIGSSEGVVNMAGRAADAHASAVEANTELEKERVERYMEAGLTFEEAHEQVDRINKRFGDGD